METKKNDIVYAGEELNPEDFYADDEMVITISHMAHKTNSITEFKAQNREE